MPSSERGKAEPDFAPLLPVALASRLERELVGQVPHGAQDKHKAVPRLRTTLSGEHLMGFESDDLCGKPHATAPPPQSEPIHVSKPQGRLRTALSGEHMMGFESDDWAKSLGTPSASASSSTTPAGSQDMAWQEHVAFFTQISMD
jgi:hypothetical protein